MKIFKFGLIKLIFSIFFLSSFSFATNINFGLTESTAGNGSSIYLYGKDNTDIYQYNLSTNYDLSTVSYFTTQNNPGYWHYYGLGLSSDGTKLFMGDNYQDKIYKADLSTAWDLSTKGGYSVVLNVNSIDGDLKGFYFRKDGLKFFFYGKSTKTLYSYDLSTAWDLTTVSNLQSNNIGLSYTNSIFFSNDGLNVYFNADYGERLRQYTLSTARDISTLTYVSTLDTYSSDHYPYGLGFSEDGTSLYFIGNTADSVYKYNLSTPWNISSAVSSQSFSFASHDGNVESLFIRNDVLTSIDNFKTDFQVKNNLLDLNICGDFDGGDDLTLSSGSNILNGIQSGSCFNFAYVPKTTYILELNGSELNKQYDGTSFNINNSDINGFNNKLVDGSSSDIIGSISSINYTSSTNDYIKINVNGGSQLVSLGLFNEISITNGTYSISNGNKNYSFVYNTNINFRESSTPLVYSNISQGDYNIYLEGVFNLVNSGTDKKFIAEGQSQFNYTGTSVAILTTTGGLALLDTGNVFMPLHTQFVELFMSGINAYVLWAIGIIMVVLLVGIAKLGKRR